MMYLKHFDVENENCVCDGGGGGGGGGCGGGGIVFILFFIFELLMIIVIIYSIYVPHNNPSKLDTHRKLFR